MRFGAVGVGLVLSLLVACGRSEPARITLVPAPSKEPSVHFWSPDPNKVLRVFVHEKGFPPLDFGVTPGDHPKGIYPEILDALSRKTGVPWVPVPLPPGRVYQGFRTEDINTEIGCNPAWRESEADISLYTAPFTTDSNVLAFRKNRQFSIPVSRVNDRGSTYTMGTIIGYVYPSLEGDFQNQTLTRVAVNNEQTLMSVLSAGHVDSIIITRLVAQYYMKTQSYQFELSLPRDELPLSIRLHKNLAWLLEPLDRALEELKADGTIERIYRSYR